MNVKKNIEEEIQTIKNSIVYIVEDSWNFGDDKTKLGIECLIDFNILPDKYKKAFAETIDKEKNINDSMTSRIVFSYDINTNDILFEMMLIDHSNADYSETTEIYNCSEVNKNFSFDFLNMIKNDLEEKMCHDGKLTQSVEQYISKIKEEIEEKDLSKWKYIDLYIDTLIKFPEMYKQDIMSKNEFIAYIEDNNRNCQEYKRIIHVTSNEMRNLVKFWAGEKTDCDITKYCEQDDHHDQQVKRNQFYTFEDDGSITTFDNYSGEMFGESFDKHNILLGLMWLKGCGIIELEQMKSYVLNEDIEEVDHEL